MILILNGPNLNMLGQREPEIYGSETLADLEAYCQDVAFDLGLQLSFRQSNHEGVLIDWLQAAKGEGARAVILNPGGLTHSSVSLRDAVSAVALPTVEVHISNIYKRESFRHHSYISGVAQGTVAGLGLFGYEAALRYLAGVLEPNAFIS